MNKLLKDAIADAKAVRETALANAKAALEEAFAPKLQSMLSHKIAEEADETEEMSTEDEVAKMQELAGIREEEDEENFSDDEGAPAEEEMPAEEEDFSDDEEMPAEEEEEDFSDDEELEELLRELEGEEGEEVSAEEEESMEETEDPEAYGENEMDEEIDLNELIQALKEEEGEEEEKEDKEEMEEAKMKMKKSKMMETELNEAYNVIKFLRGKLSEVNLLNAKLLFVNKLFRKANLTESQKVKIIETFDRAKNVRETKLIYSTLVESINNKPVTKTSNKVNKITEGFASAPQKKTTKILTESDAIYNRFKELVNYNNNY